MTLAKRDYDTVRFQVLNLLRNGPQSVEGIKESVRTTRCYYAGEVDDATVAGRSQLDAMLWKILSSLCNAGLAKSTTMRRFRITRDGEEMVLKCEASITAENLSESAHYRRLASEPNPSPAMPSPKKASVQRGSGIVALIDMLGTREPRAGRDAEQLHSNWNALMTYAKRTVQREPGLQGCEVSAFSDTMFITARGEAEALLGPFGMMATWLIPKSIDLGIPIRGCVAAGAFWQSDQNLFTGPAVTEAAAYYERPQWIGISSCPSAHNKIDGLESSGASYTKFDIPLKGSVEHGGIVVNWPDRYNHEHIDREGELDRMLNVLDCKLEETRDIDASLKWRNTRDFLCAATGVEGRPIRSSS